MMTGRENRVHLTMRSMFGERACPEIVGDIRDEDPLARLMGAAQKGDRTAYSELLRAIIPWFADTPYAVVHSLDTLTLTILCRKSCARCTRYARHTIREGPSNPGFSPLHIIVWSMP